MVIQNIFYGWVMDENDIPCSVMDWYDEKWAMWWEMRDERWEIEMMGERCEVGGDARCKYNVIK